MGWPRLTCRGVSILWETPQIYRYLIISNSTLKSATE